MTYQHGPDDQETHEMQPPPDADIRARGVSRTAGKNAGGEQGAGAASRSPATDEPGPSPDEAASPRRWFAYRCPYAVFEAETLKRFGDVGVDLVQISPLNTLSSLGVPYSPYPSSWVGPDTIMTSVRWTATSPMCTRPMIGCVCSAPLT